MLLTTSNMLKYLFTSIEPFRCALLCMLAPFEIAKLLDAMNCEVTDWERKTHMDILDDIFDDSTVITTMRRLDMTVRLFGADLEILERRLLEPRAELTQGTSERPLNVFVLASHRSNHHENPTSLLREYELLSREENFPVDMSFAELQDAFGTETAAEISRLSYWILCSPSLSGRVPGNTPGWFPVFNARPFVNVRAFISSFEWCNGRILQMDRISMRNVFGYLDNDTLLTNISDLSTVCLKLQKDTVSRQHIKGKITTNILHNVLAAAYESKSTDIDTYTVVNVIHPLNSSITLSLN